MITSEDVRRVTFEKSMRGYRCEDVDHYLKQVAESMDAMAAQNDDLQKKLVVLAQRIDQYRAEEDTLRSTMINAQRLGENVIREAKQKAADIIRAANLKADDREQRARDDVELAKQEIVTLKSEADSFKRSLMDLYRKHINLISKLPEYDRMGEGPKDAQEPAQEAPAPVPEQPAPQPTREAQGTSYVPPVDQQPVAPETPEPDEYDAPAPQPAPQPEPEKVDTVEFAIAPHADEPAEEPVSEPEPSRFQPGAGLYDVQEEPAPMVRKAKHSQGKRGGRKAKNAAPQEELDSPAFDNFEGVDFDS